MINVNKLKGKIVEQGFTLESVATAMSLHRSTMYRKLAGECSLTVHEADQLVGILHLSSNEALAIFFSQFVA